MVFTTNIRGEERRKEHFRKCNMQLYIIKESLKVVLMKSIGDLVVVGQNYVEGEIRTFFPLKQ